MNDGDPHIHVDVDMHRGAATRDMLASTFGLVADLPAAVTTGCGERVPRAMTSPRPESVTCLPCREHAARWHRKAAEDVDRMAGTPAMFLPLPAGQLHEAARQHHDLARRFEAR